MSVGRREAGVAYLFTGKYFVDKRQVLLLCRTSVGNADFFFFFLIKLFPQSELVSALLTTPFVTAGQIPVARIDPANNTQGTAPLM